MLLLLSLLASAQALPVDHGNSPTVLQYVLEAVLDLPEWSRYLPDDIDVDKDGNLNEKEVELKFKSYVKDAFDQLDKDVDKLVTRDEFRNASINLNGINKIIDIAMESYPIKTYFDFADINQDGFLAEDDFLISENRYKLLHEYYKEKFGDKLPKNWHGNQEERGNSPTVLQYVLESVPEWSPHFSDDIDVDKDGNLSEKEVELKFKSYVKEAFDQLDKDVDKLVTRDEFRNASINLNGINKIIDIAMQSYPIKTYFSFGDKNQDGFIAEDDFLLSENKDKLLHEYYKEKFGGRLPENWGANRKEIDTKWTRRNSVPAFKKDRSISEELLCAESFGEKEAQVLCREMGHTGVQSVSSISFEEYRSTEGYYATIRPYGYIFDCQGTETKLEECRTSRNSDASYYKRCPKRSTLLASVNCAFNKEIGEVELVGGKDGSSGDLHIGLEKYCGDINHPMAKVVCTELGFVAGTPLVTSHNFFTSGDGPPITKRRFECNGSEQKLQDCPPVQSNTTERSRNSCYSPDNGIICQPDQHMWNNLRNLELPRGERGYYFVWELWGRYLFVADLNDDHKVSLEELGTKIKEIAAAVFQVLDQTDDGVFSTSDLTTLNVRLPDVLNLARNFLQFLARGEQQINLYNLRIGYAQEPLSDFDYNQDGIINLKDLSLLIDSSQLEGLLTILSRKLDINQDGIILVTELDNYIKRVLDHLGGGTLTTDTVWKLMKKSQFTCLQLNGIQTFAEAVADTIETQSKKMLDYFFRELDLDGDGEISVEELYNAHVPCDEVNTGRIPGINSDRVGCARIFDQLIYPESPPRAPRLHRFDADVEEIANAVCVALQADI